jgi:hypothetical protein
MSIGQNDINRRTHSLDILDFQDRTREIRDVHQALVHPLLSQFRKKQEHIGDTFTGEGRSRNEGYDTSEFLVFVKDLGVESVLGETELDFT